MVKECLKVSLYDINCILTLEVEQKYLIQSMSWVSYLLRTGRKQEDLLWLRGFTEEESEWRDDIIAYFIKEWVTSR